MSEGARQIVEGLRGRLRRVARRRYAAEAAAGAVLVGGVLVSFWLVFALAEAMFRFPSAVRLVLIGIAAATAAVFGIAYVLLPLMRLSGLVRGMTQEETALLVGGRYPEVSDRLVNLLQLADGRSSPAPESLVDRAVTSLAASFSAVPFEGVATFGRARALGRWAAVPVAGVLLFTLLAPATFFGATKRLLSPSVAFARPAPFSFDVTPGDADLVRGEDLPVAVRVDGSPPEAVSLVFSRLAEQTPERVRLPLDSSGSYRHTLQALREPIRYRIEADGVRSEWFNVSIEERPTVRRLQLAL